MALTTVVMDRFFERLLPLLREMDSDADLGPLTLAMLVPSSIGDDYRSLVLASPTLDSIGLARATRLLQSKLRDRLGPDASRIESVSVLRTRDSAVQWLGRAYDIRELGTAYKAIGMPLMELGLDDPIIFVSRQVSAVAA